MDDMVRRRRLSQRLPLMAGLTAGFAVGFTPQALRPLLGRWLLQAVTRRGLAAGLTVESRLPFQRDDPLLKRLVNFELLQIRSLKVGGAACSIRKGWKWEF
jgi:hypothetical protein